MTSKDRADELKDAKRKADVIVSCMNNLYEELFRKEIDIGIMPSVEEVGLGYDGYGKLGFIVGDDVLSDPDEIIEEMNTMFRNIQKGLSREIRKQYKED